MGFGSDISGNRLADWWEFDMMTLQFRQLATFPGAGRLHPSMVSVYSDKENDWEIHVGLGNGFNNFNDYWSYSVNNDQWIQLPNFPSSQRHHPYYFGLGGVSYTGSGHSSKIERDFYSFNGTAWTKEPDFESYSMNNENNLVTTEARVAGTQFSIVLPMRGSTDGGSGELSGTIGFVLSGDGDDHRAINTGEFHAFYPNATKKWRTLPPHPGVSRWAPGSFVMRGTARVTSRVVMNTPPASSIRMFGRLTCHLCLPNSYHPHKVQRPQNAHQPSLEVQLPNVHQLTSHLPNDQPQLPPRPRVSLKLGCQLLRRRKNLQLKLPRANVRLGFQVQKGHHVKPLV